MDTIRNDKLDAVIKAELKLVEGEIALSSTMMVLMVLAAMTLYMSVLAIPALIAALYFIYRAYWKLFYDSVFGSSCGLYQALPIPHSHRVLSKIFAAAVCQSVPIGVLLIVFAFFNVIMGYGLMGDFFDLLSEIGLGQTDEAHTPLQTALLLSCDLLSMIFNQLSYVSIIFLAVTSYQVQPQEKHNLIRKILTIAAGWLSLQVLKDGVSWIFQLLKTELPLLETGADLLLQIVVLIVTYRLTVGLLEKHYQKG